MPPCTQVPLTAPLVIAIAQDATVKPTTPFADMTNLSAMAPPKYGQDITFGIGRAAPGKEDVGSTPAILEPKMRRLLTIFAGGDTTGMAKRLFDAFLDPTHRAVTYFDDASLNSAADTHANMNYFCSAAVSAPNSPFKTAGKIRIHQALKNAGWDITKMYMPTGLGVPAFNLGNKTLSTQDFNNGLGLMLNGVQYVYVVATHYNYDSAAGRYCMKLKFIMFDIFGLDDEDLSSFGASADSGWHTNAGIGITAWWQLQHQHGYAPLVTRIVVEKTYDAPAE